MGKAGKKLIAAAKEAVKVAACDHEWRATNIDLDIKGNIRRVVDRCDFCNARRTQWVSPPPLNPKGE